MGILFLVFAVSMAAATFIENDYGSDAAYGFVYDTRWFELILILLSVNLVGQMIIYRLYRKSKLTVFIFHLSFVLIIAGAGITRYFGWEGTMHIREGEEQVRCFSNERYLEFAIRGNDGTVISQHSEKYSINTVSADNYRRKIKIDDKEYDLVLSRIIPNASEIIADDPDGEPLISFLSINDQIRETLIFRQGEVKLIDNISVGFDTEEETDIRINADSTSFLISSRLPVSQMNMMTRETKMIEPGQLVVLEKMQIFTLNDIRLIPQDLSLKGILKAEPVNIRIQETGQNVLLFHLFSDNKVLTTIYLWNKATEKTASATAAIGNNTIEISFGSSITTLPFSLRLNEFVFDRYPGSNSPSGYKSDVVLIDKTENIERPFTIYMNNILKYKGFRFYQSSYDQDEKGTILSVNNDVAGMFVTYTGYGLLFLFVIMSLLNRKSVFHNVTAEYWNSPLRKILPLVMMLFILSGFGSIGAQKLVPDKTIANEFGNILVQDQKGRTKPLFTLSNDILRKVTGENKLKGLSSMQVFLGLYMDFDNWKSEPLIRISNRELQMQLGVKGNFAAFTDMVDLDSRGSYKLAEIVNNVYMKSPGERSRFDKEIIKVDERANIIYMIYTGGFLKIFPLKDGTNHWGSSQNALPSAINKEDSLYLGRIIPLFSEALQANNITTARQVTASIIEYQKRFSEYELPSESRIKAELLYYKMMIFERLFPFYATVGIILLTGLIVMVILGKKGSSLFTRVPGWLLFTGFLFHTFGLGLRWYISGHSPMSNGYESMIFISWVTLLAGFIFSRKSVFALSATAILAAMTLMVAHLSFMDPEITNLVPVLKSYWLTLHVSIITGSYGFLGLGAILGIIVMILLSLSGRSNLDRISATIDELTVINFRTLAIGLYLLTIGTFLGAIWANESWGRYWGWDPKETWSLITIIIYSMVIHSRMIPGMKDIYTFNLLSLFAFSSVLMTYFGVNYYLSGLHSYAGGDPVPVPVFVYIGFALLIALSFTGYWRYRKWEQSDTK